MLGVLVSLLVVVGALAGVALHGIPVVLVGVVFGVWLEEPRMPHNPPPPAKATSRGPESLNPQALKPLQRQSLNPKP